MLGQLAKAASLVLVTGATGRNASKINGRYQPCGEIYNDKPLYQKADNDDVYIVCSSSKKEKNVWRIRQRFPTARDDTECMAKCLDEECEDPTFARRWLCYLGKSKWDEPRGFLVSNVTSKLEKEQGSSPPVVGTVPGHVSSLVLPVV